MSTPRPVRSSARQSALKQEQEAELAAKREQIALAKKERDQEKDQDRGFLSSSSSSSSRSLSPALSDSASLSSGDEEDPLDNNQRRSYRNSRRQQPEGEEEEEQDPSKPFKDPHLHSYWEIAFIYGFLTKFKALLRQSCPLHEFSLEDIEAGLLSRTSNACIEEIHANLLSNMLNRKKAVDAHTWQKVLSETLDMKIRTLEMEYDQNPLRYYGDYYKLPPDDRVHILKSLVHWVLQECTVIRTGIEQDNECYMVEPFGSDQTKRIYWYFGEGTLTVYRETKGTKKKSGTWETVANNLEELHKLADSFNGTSSKPEKALQERLHEEIINPAEDKLLQNKMKQERLEKRMQKLAELHQLAATRTTRTRSSNRVNHPKYNFDDDEEDFEQDEYDLYRRPSSRRRYNNNLDHDKEQQNHQERRSASVEAASSARSSVGHDSDTSLRDALQRTRVGDEDDRFTPEESREIDVDHENVEQEEIHRRANVQAEGLENRPDTTIPSFPASPVPSYPNTAGPSAAPSSETNTAPVPLSETFSAPEAAEQDTEMKSADV